MERVFLDVLDAIEEGLIILDRKGIIKTYNRSAKEITGLTLPHAHPHPEGKLEPGDLVILADNRMGYDDGDLQVEDLEHIGVTFPDRSPSTGDAVIAVGTYGMTKRSSERGSEQGRCKYWKNRITYQHMSFHQTVRAHTIHAVIDTQEKQIVITVDDMPYALPFSLAVGHMVVLSPSGALKFYQARGYGIRSESIAELLSGKPFRAKGPGADGMDVIGMPLDRIFDSGPLTEHLRAYLSGKRAPFTNDFYEIYKRPTLCSILPLAGSTDSLLKILDISNIEALIDERNQLIMTIEARHKNDATKYEAGGRWQSEGIIGYSPAMQRVQYLVEKAAATKSTVLITGESGTGKTFIAREIHALSPSPHAPFISVNCTAIPHTLFESELFGYERGAFTGAERTGKPGLFELAETGTLFLDEIGELPLDMQVKLLHVLQNKSFYRVGATTPTHVDVRVIAATNKDLNKEMARKRFRKDLYYRLNSFPIEMPPLRERKSDLYTLIHTLMTRLSLELGTPPKRISGKALDLLISYHWPGNIRELEHALELAINISDGEWIDEEDLNLSEYTPNEPSLKAHMAAEEKNYIESILSRHPNDLKSVLSELGISKTTLYDKMKRHGIRLKKS